MCMGKSCHLVIFTNLASTWKCAQKLVLPCHSLHARLILEYEVEKCENICMFVPELILLENGGRIIVSIMLCFIGNYICVYGALSLEFFVHFVFKLC